MESKGVDGGAKGFIFLSTPRAWDAPGLECGEQADGLFKFLLATGADSAAISHYQTDIFVKLNFSLKELRSIDHPPLLAPQPSSTVIRIHAYLPGSRCFRPH